MPVELKTLPQVFNECFFRIPDYQRGYSWQKKQLNDFWVDIIELAAGKNHYTGVITVEPMSDDKYLRSDEEIWLVQQKQLKPLFIVDGQQRLTTAMILICAIIDSGIDLGESDPQELTNKYLWIRRKSDDAKVCIFGYEKDNPSYEFWKTKILKLHSSENEDKQTAYTRNLQEAYDFFAEKIKDDILPVTEVLKRVVNGLRFNYYEIDSSFDVFVAFETMNNRGKDLSKLELLKNRLIYLSTLYKTKVGESEAIALRAKINTVWKTIYEHLGKRRDLQLDDDEFLKLHWIMFFGFKRDKAEQYAEFLLNEKFIARNVSSDLLKITEVHKYIDSLQTTIKNWFVLMSEETETPSEQEIISRLNKLGYRCFVPLCLAAMSSDRNQAHKLMAAVERFNFVVYNLYDRRADYGYSEFQRLANDVYLKITSVAEAINKINDWILDTSETWRLVTMVTKLYSDELGFYDWTGLKYFLYVYEAALQNAAMEDDSKIDWTKLAKSKDTIEHILPQTTTDEYWKICIRNRNAAEVNILKHSLGNLLLLSRKKNSSLSNQGFKLKCHDTARGYSSGSFSEIKVSKNEEWGEKEILNRGIEMLEFIEKTWKVSLGEREQKKQILKLEFVESGLC